MKQTEDTTLIFNTYAGVVDIMCYNILMIHLEPFAVEHGKLPYDLASAEPALTKLVTSVYRVKERDALGKLTGLCFLAKPAFDRETVIGVVNLDRAARDELELPDAAWINTLVVAEQYRRGGEHGSPRVGSILADRVISIAQRYGVGSIALESVTEPGSIQFWEQHGFRIAEKQPPSIRIGTELMIRPL